ncbi:hypothetical protein RJ640_029010 [Escallonia rubra]|uniref:Uncharacterized protein n=1 Tax=Escallonia rubra TaxID=112253 RepID=A0AA88S3D3_9ASTE|nr:hypothetical protein RJ640_029010 [Escallonia rubra]
MAVHMKYPFKRFSTLARAAGANYRLLARLDHHRSAHYGRLWAMWIKMEMPFNLWIRRGRLANIFDPNLRIYSLLEDEPRLNGGGDFDRLVSGEEKGVVGLVGLEPTILPL